MVHKLETLTKDYSI